MSLRSTNIRRLAGSIAIVLVGTGVPSLVIGLGCADDLTYPAPSGPPNDRASSGGTASSGDGGPTIDLCGCAVVLETLDCSDCNVKVGMGGASCGSSQATCANSTVCTTDAKCIGTCLADAATPEPACVSACIKAAGKEYITYLSCICHHCTSVCSSQTTCP